MLLENFIKFMKYYGKGKTGGFLFFLVLSLIAGFLELIGLALIYPFVLLMIKPDAIKNLWLSKLSYNPKYALLLGLVVVLIFIFKNLFMIYTQYYQNKFAHTLKQDIIKTFMNYYVLSPYKDTVKIQPSSKLYIIESAVVQVIDGFVLRLFNLIINSFIVFTIISLLLVKFLIPAVTTIAFVISSILLQNKLFKKKINAISAVIAQKGQELKNSMHENINNIKEIKIMTSEKYFLDKFNQKSSDVVKLNIQNGFFGTIPPYIIEILIVTSLLILAAIISLQSGGDNSSMIASFAIVIAALFRIAPALNRIQTSIININGARDFVKRLNDKYEAYCFNNPPQLPVYNENILKFEDKIEFRNVSFSYDGIKKTVDDASFTVHKGEFVGIIGLSGAGKTTLADVLTGLLPVDSGQILLDDTPLDESNFHNFRRLIGYVPQQINIISGTFVDNVAWGHNDKNPDKVREALIKAQLFDVIEEQKDGIYTELTGANGLSYGQRQRLAIARALYNDPEIIILDEATSSLDVQVENEITSMLKQIGKSKTIIAIAHRLSTLKAANKLIYMKDGKIVDIGTFGSLSLRYEEFANLVKLSSIN